MGASQRAFVTLVFATITQMSLSIIFIPCLSFQKEIDACYNKPLAYLD